MTWGTFSLTHMITLLLAPIIGVGLYFLLKKRSLAWKKVILGVLSLSGIAAILFNLLMWDSPLEYLPLHLCSLNAMILPVAVMTRSKILSNLLLLWSLGSFIALPLNYSVASCDVFSWTFFFYYFPHVMECVIPILLFALGLVKLDIKCILSTISITMAAYTLIHFVNVGINTYCVENAITDHAGSIIQVNYMFSISPDNPLLALFHSIIPSPYWYMYLAIPVAVVYLGGIYGTHHLLAQRKKVSRSPK